MDPRGAARQQASLNLDHTNHAREVNEAHLPTIMSASSNMESEPGTPRSGPGQYALRPSYRGGLLQNCPNTQHLRSKQLPFPGQQIPKRVRFVGDPAHDSDPDGTWLIRDALSIESNISKAGQALPSMNGRSGAQVGCLYV